MNVQWLQRGSAALVCAYLVSGCLMMDTGDTSSTSMSTTSASGASSGGSGTSGSSSTSTGSNSSASSGSSSTSGAPFVPPFAGGGGGTSSSLTGFLSYSQQTGEISGNAYDSSNSSIVVTVEIYINGPMGSGTLLSSVSANQTLVSGGVANGFTYTPAAAYIDSTPRKLYAYMSEPGGSAPVLIGGASVDYFAGPDANGVAYFNANLSSTLGSKCVACHQSEWSNYYNARGELGDPSPISGGTATTNTLYLKASGGLNHSGGNQCAGNSICQDIAAWWAKDFGN